MRCVWRPESLAVPGSPVLPRGCARWPGLLPVLTCASHLCMHVGMLAGLCACDDVGVYPVMACRRRAARRGQQAHPQPALPTQQCTRRPQDWTLPCCQPQRFRAAGWASACCNALAWPVCSQAQHPDSSMQSSSNCCPNSSVQNEACSVQVVFAHRSTAQHREERAVVANDQWARCAREGKY